MDLPEPESDSFVDLGRGSLRVWGWGDPSAPPVVCLHGAFDHGRMFDELAPRVASLGYHVLAPDLRGHGDSSPLDTGMAWTLIHLDIVLLMRHLDSGPVGLIGHSFGGGQAGGVAAAWPDMVRWIVNIDGLGPSAAEIGPPDDIPGALRSSFARTDRALLAGRRPWASIEDMAAYRKRSNLRLPDEWALHLARHGARPVEGGWVWKSDPMFGIGVPSEFDLAMLQAEMRSVSCPVLVLSGDQEDTWTDLTPAEVEERSGWLGGRLVVIPGTGHYVHIEEPDATFDAIRDFLAEVGP